MAAPHRTRRSGGGSVTIFDRIHPARAGSAWRDDPRRAVVPRQFASAGHRDFSGRIKHYRKVFSWAAITCPAHALRQPGVAAIVNKRGHRVDVGTYDELTFALSAGVPPARIVMHDDQVTAAPIRCGVNAHVGQLVIGCSQQIKVLASCAQRPPRILLDMGGDCADDAVTAVFAHRRLDLIGLHATLTRATRCADYTEVVAAIIATMARIRRQRNAILTRVSLAGGDILSGATTGPDDLRVLAAALEDTFDDACARFRYPRPALILAPW
jgi:diaminopimelate decarboxylase